MIESKKLKKMCQVLKKSSSLTFLAQMKSMNLQNGWTSKRVMSAIEYKKSKFSDPLYIMYSSGTTGKPKCIVHSIGGTLLQHIKEHGLHGNMSAEKNVFFFHHLRLDDVELAREWTLFGGNYYPV